MASQVTYIRIMESLDTSDPVEVPLEKDNTLLLSTLVAQCPSAIGLRFRSNTGAWRGLKTLGQNIHAPPQGWGLTNYYVVREPAKLTKRGTGRGDVAAPVAKIPKLTDLMSDGDTLFQKSVQARLEKLQEDQLLKTMEPLLQQSTNTGTRCSTELDRRKAGQVRRVQHLEKMEQNYTPTLPQKRGFQIVYMAGLNTKPGRPIVITEALHVLRMYSAKVYRSGDDPSYFEVRRLTKAERDLIFIETDMKDPSLLSDALYNDLLSGKCEPAVFNVVKCWKKFTPISITSTSSHQDIVHNVKEVVKPLIRHVNCGQLTFRLWVPGNTFMYRDIYRMLKFKEFNDFLLSNGLPDECWSSSSEYCIFVRLCDNICFISLLRNFARFKLYNVTELCQEIINNGGAPKPPSSNLSTMIPHKGTNIDTSTRTGPSDMPGVRLVEEEYVSHLYKIQQHQHQHLNNPAGSSSSVGPRSNTRNMSNNTVNRSQYCVIS